VAPPAFRNEIKFRIRTVRERLFPNEDPIGKEMRRNQQLPWDTVIGVAGNARNNPALSDNDDPEYYACENTERQYRGERQVSLSAPS
jgi:hypothetical protein